MNFPSNRHTVIDMIYIPLSRFFFALALVALSAATGYLEGKRVMAVELTTRMEEIEQKTKLLLVATDEWATRVMALEIQQQKANKDISNQECLALSTKDGTTNMIKNAALRAFESFKEGKETLETFRFWFEVLQYLSSI